MIILGVDPGFARLGYGVIDKRKRSLVHIADGVIATTARQTHIERLLCIEQALVKIIKQYKPEIVAVEELFMHKNVKTAMKVCEARGVIMLTLGKQKKEALEFTPLEIKQALTGYGRADKRQVQRMVQRLLGLPALPKQACLLGLPARQVGRQDDASDALAAAICCANSLNI